MNYQQTIQCVIFRNINIQIVNLGRDKIDELNKLYGCIEKFIKYQEQTESVSGHVIEIITILEQLLEDTGKGWFIDLKNFNTYGHPYIQALRSSFYFLNFLKKDVLPLEILNPKIYEDFSNLVWTKTQKILPSGNASDFHFKLKIYEWLLHNNLIKKTYHYEFYFSTDELEAFYQKNNKSILKYIIENHSIELEHLCPQNDLHSKTYITMAKEFNEIS